jgi:hypothetical protein
LLCTLCLQGNTTLTGIMELHWHEKKPERILFQGKVRGASGPETPSVRLF